ncbi:MAG: HAMP domain-containing protein [Acidobacteriaceae bacterium]|nr:HAMP domain-containing protein [Acidobacteriaceae bacterium]MBV9779472.1 HAMP domain-containing protein [Acidobacteriaceae bacterium]
MREISIRLRLTAWYALVLAAGLFLLAALIWISLRHTLIREVDEGLASRARSFELFLNHELTEGPATTLKEELEEFCKGLPDSSFLRLRSVDGDFTFSYPVNPPSTGQANLPYVAVRVQGHRYRVLHHDISARSTHYTLEIGISLDTIEHVLNVLETLFLSLIPTIILIACIGGFWVSRRALRPVDAMTAAARSISIDNISSRLPVPQTGDELQRLAEAWNTMLDRLETAIKRVLQFSADASHELRTPLAIIRTSTELALRRPRTPEEYRESLNQVKTEIGRMTQLVEDLLFLARSDASAVEMPTELLDLSNSVQSACSEVQPIADFRHVNVMCSLPDSRVLVKGNQPALRRLFLALLDNAIKYSEPGGRVELLLRTAGNRTEVTIKDSGPGIPPQDLPHIFERFYRADRLRTRPDGGHGLGLALAESIALRHGATISVESYLNQGSEFRVSFPDEAHALPLTQPHGDSSGTEASCEPVTGARVDPP